MEYYWALASVWSNAIAALIITRPVTTAPSACVGAKPVGAALMAVLPPRSPTTTPVVPTMIRWHGLSMVWKRRRRVLGGQC